METSDFQAPEIKTNLDFDPKEIEFVVACSGGNDSVALIQLMLDKYPARKMLVLYNDTGWAREDWPARMDKIADMLKERGVVFVATQSIGFEKLVKQQKGFPMPASSMQFCTSHLKTGPTLGFLNQHDPEKEWTIVTGRRREESLNRSGLALLETDTKVYEGRDVFNPLIKHKEAERDDLIRRFGLTPLPHSSMECFPCVCSKRGDLEMLSKHPETVQRIKVIELDMGHTSNGKPRTMFRPYRSGGGVGIEQVLEWALGPRGTKVHKIPKEYQIPGVDYSNYRGDMSSEERKVFWANIKQQCIDLGYDLKDLPTDVAYDDTSLQGKAFDRQCDGGLCGN